MTREVGKQDPVCSSEHRCSTSSNCLLYPSSEARLLQALQFLLPYKLHCRFLAPRLCSVFLPAEPLFHCHYNSALLNIAVQDPRIIKKEKVLKNRKTVNIHAVNATAIWQPQRTNLQLCTSSVTICVRRFPQLDLVFPQIVFQFCCKVFLLGHAYWKIQLECLVLRM